MDLESLQKGGPSSFEGFPGPTLLGSLVSGPMEMEGRLTWPLHIVRRGLYPREVLAVV